MPLLLITIYCKLWDQKLIWGHHINKQACTKFHMCLSRQKFSCHSPFLNGNSICEHCWNCETFLGNSPYWFVNLKKQMPFSWLFILCLLLKWTTSENVRGENMLKTSFTVYISVYYTKDARNVSSQEKIVHLIVFKYDAFSASYVIK